MGCPDCLIFRAVNEPPKSPAPPRGSAPSQPDYNLQTKFIVLFGILALLPLVIFWQFGMRRTPPNTTTLAEKKISGISEAKFTDITKEAGIDFIHENGAAGEKLLPETMGSGCAFFDFDGDGDQDILFVNSTFWPWAQSSGKKAPTLALYANDGHGKFTDVTAGSGLDVSLYGMGVAAGDFDNDGKVDLFISAVGGNKLFRNLGNGKFQDVTAAAGVGGTGKDWSTSCAFIDYDNDGDLDLFVCNYVQWSRELDLQVDYRLPGLGRAYGPPMNFAGTFPYLYRNEGNGHFTDVSSSAGVQVRNKATGLPMAKSLGVSPVDLENDGWIDLVVANDTVQNFVFHNNENGTFTEIGGKSGLAYDPYGSTRGAMGIDTGRFQDDDTLGISIGNFANEMTALYVAQTDPLFFTDQALEAGIGNVSRNMLTFGIFFFDYDLNGFLDLLTANGHIEPEIGKVRPNQNYLQPAQLFWNRGTGPQKERFILVPESNCGPDLFRPMAGRGSAYADIDGDGDLDILITQVGGPPRLLRNEQHLNHNWIRLSLVGTKSNHDAIGAWIKVRIGNRTLTRQVMPTRGYLSQSELPVTIGLGNAAKVDDLQIIWPDHSVQTFQPKLNALNVVIQK
jgi:hypothetical protein